MPQHNLRRMDVPQHPAYLVWHDAFDNGAMDVYPATSYEIAQNVALHRNNRNESLGNDDAGFWKEYIKLPRKKIYAFYPETVIDSTYVKGYKEVL